MDTLSPKRIKLEENNCALNLSLSSETHQERYKEVESTTKEDNIDDLLQMRNKFQQWVLETYRDASKTKTITAKKYERIVKTLRGEIKNCAENSKFRFWMKCKGFKLEFEGRDKTLYVLDKKGETIKYKKVAIVENFFDIIYDVHVNEGARGIQHAGQKRTHRTITETYAFLPREAVTKFLLCCADCQKRTSEERKNSSPNLTSSSSHDSSKNDEPVKSRDFSNSEIIEKSEIPIKIPPSYLQNKVESFNDKPINEVPCNVDPKTYESNNNVIKEDCVTTPHTPIYRGNYRPKTSKLVDIRNLITSDNDAETDQPKLRKRKRKFTRKIVRSDRIESCDLYEFGYSALNCPTSTPQCDNAAFPPISNHIMQKPDDCFPPHFQSHIEKCSVTSAPLLNTMTTTTNETTGENLNFIYLSKTNCPYLTKITEILFNPFQYAVTKKKQNITSITTEDDFLEQLAVNLVLKAREVEMTKNNLSENERQQISDKIYNSRITSFLLNYAADVMLRSLHCETN